MRPCNPSPTLRFAGRSVHGGPIGRTQKLENICLCHHVAEMLKRPSQPVSKGTNKNARKSERPMHESILQKRHQNHEIRPFAGFRDQEPKRKITRDPKRHKTQHHPSIFCILGERVEGRCCCLPRPVLWMPLASHAA